MFSETLWMLSFDYQASMENLSQKEFPMLAKYSEV